MFSSGFLAKLYPKEGFFNVTCILDYQEFVLLVLVVPLIASLAFENLLELGCSLVRIIERCPLVLPTVSNSAPAIE